MDAFSVQTPGAYTTVQDKGRYGYQQMGIPVSGALDSFAFKVANLLVQNPENRAVLEITFMGPCLEVLINADIAVTGAEMEITLNDRPVEGWKSLRVAPGDILNIIQAKSGCCAYLAITRGISVPEIMGSRSTYASGKIGGFYGRQLKPGDIIKSCRGSLLDKPRQFAIAMRAMIPRYPSKIVLRAIPGPQDNYFHEGMIEFFQSEFNVSPDANRMGYRLQGPAIKNREEMPKSIISEPSVPGGIQIPADGQPIILLAEQTVGGYSKIATVISSDLWKVAQAIPGDTIRFEQVTLETAHAVYHDRQQLMHELEKKHIITVSS